MASSTYSSSSSDTPYSFARAMRLSVSGDDSDRSHLETAWRDTPSFSARASWDSPACLRRAARRSAISTFMMWSLSSAFAFLDCLRAYRNAAARATNSRCHFPQLLVAECLIWENTALSCANTADRAHRRAPRCWSAAIYFLSRRAFSFAKVSAGMRSATVRLGATFGVSSSRASS